MAGVKWSASAGAGLTVVALRAELDIVAAASAVAATIAGMPRGQHLVIDPAASDVIDRGSLGTLMGVQQLARQAGGDALLAAPGKRVSRGQRR